MSETPPFYLDSKIFGQGEHVFINKKYINSKISLHAHDFIEIVYIASGKGVHRIGRNQYTVSKGNLFVINYNVPHEFIPENELLVYNCIFTPDFLDYSLVSSKDFSSITHHFLFRSLFPEKEISDDIMLLNLDNWAIEEICDKMYREYTGKDHGYIEIIRAYIIELLVLIFRALKKNSILKDGTEINHRQLIEKVIKYIKDNLFSDFKLEELSMIAFLSPSYFCRLFKEYTGRTVSEHTQKLRIEEACNLLRQTDRKVIEIAFDVGYRDIKHFNQVFRKITGKTPGEYRKVLKDQRVHDKL